MSKIPEPTEDAYEAAQYFTIEQFLAHFNTAIADIDPSLLQKYRNYVDNANRTVESALLKYADQLPLKENSATRAFAKDMAYHWSLYEKQTEEGSKTANETFKQWKINKENMIATMQAAPQRTTKRVVTSSNFDEEPILFSQTYGLQEFL